MICRTFSSPNAPKDLHVHDDPTLYVDVLRNNDNGWVQKYSCQRPGTSFTKGDNIPSFIIVDNIRRIV